MYTQKGHNSDRHYNIRLPVVSMTIHVYIIIITYHVRMYMYVCMCSKYIRDYTHEN